jgi:hypothetical protein
MASSPRNRVVDERARSTSKKDDFDFRPMQKGITLLKFGNRGPAHEKVFKLSGDKRFITWEGRWISPKLGKHCVGNICFFLHNNFKLVLTNQCHSITHVFVS